MIRNKIQYEVFPITMDMINAGLKGNFLVVYAYLSNRCIYSGKGCYDEGMDNLAKKLKLTPPTIYNVIKYLCDNDYIKKEYFYDEYKIKRCRLFIKED